jgi:hypothetical protein
MAKIICMFSLYQIYISNGPWTIWGHAQITQAHHWLKFASSTMEKAGLNINILCAGKPDPVIGRQTMSDTLTDAACTSQSEVLPKMDISFPYLENMIL